MTKMEGKLTLEIVEALLKTQGINHKIRGSTLLHIACGEGNFDVVDFLLGKGAWPNITNDKGNTPLLIVCEEGYAHLVSLLTSHGASVKISQSFAPNLCPLGVAISKKHFLVVERLLECGAALKVKQSQPGSSRVGQKLYR